ncbi:ribonuclease III domain-containing protein [uncultured Tyzzerella sp.]|uniref:Mini-ribonuclease 3 n=1 Tax=uncultured Tyzzerella sp. TaxID=2321398 RepID=UPI002943CD64|nr:ribonuclease III domain-containing protein [uncultured Tyzzerella sp.]
MEDKIVDIRQYSPLALAYMGDCIFDLCVREYILKQANMSANKLHQKSKALVNATSQSKMYKSLLDMVSEEEKAILKRGRNANSNTKAKNSTMIDYKNATGLEALFGYLYLKGEQQRISELFKICLEIMNN